MTHEIEGLGYSAAWMPGGVDAGVLADLDRLLTATDRLTLCTGILNLWKFEPSQVGAWWRGQTPERQARVMLGIGVSHAPLIGDPYGRPVETMRRYLEGVRAEGVPREHLCIAALGPKMLELAAELTGGAHPYLVTPDHTALARRILGGEALLAPEQGVILERDAARARELGRLALQNYLRLPNYLNSWRRLGFSEDDVSGPSERLIDALFAWGDPDFIAARVREHLDAGADHVCIQVVTGAAMSDVAPTLDTWRALSAALVGLNSV